MAYQFTVSPDFAPDHIAGWHIFNTWLQKTIGEAVHLELYDSFDDQRAAISSDNVDFIYANPYDAAMLIREKGFTPLARPLQESDEAIIAVNAENAAQTVEDLPEKINLASTDDPGVHTMGMIMLEPANLTGDTVARTVSDTYVLVAKALLNGTADVGFFLAKAYDELSKLVSSQLRPLVTSQIQVIHHTFMVSPAIVENHGDFASALLGMGDDAKGKGVLESLDLTGWAAVEQEDAEFMIDLMDTLAS